MSLTRKLARHIHGKNIDDDDLAAAALFTVDAVANAMAGRRTDPGRKLLDWAAQYGGRDAGRRALVLGGLTHILEMDDLHRASVVHPGCVVVPVAFAHSETSEIGGTETLSAILHGFEAACRIGMAVGPSHYRIWHSTATCGPFGAAMAAASLLGLDEDATVHALGNAGTQAAGLWEFLETGAMSKHLHAGRAAEAGLVAAQLAALGFTGPPKILEGARGLFAGACPDADPGAVLAGPEHNWQLHETSIKPWPSCRHTHPAVDGALELSPGFDPSAVTGISVATYGAAVDLCDRPHPDSVYEAKFSLQHCIAAALTKGRLGFDEFEETARQELATLRQKIDLKVDDAFEAAYPDAWGATVEVTFTGGQQRRAERRTCKGDPEAPLAEAELLDKARMLLAFSGIADPEILIKDILDMANGGNVPALPY